jgi:hypothetical protein
MTQSTWRYRALLANSMTVRYCHNELVAKLYTTVRMRHQSRSNFFYPQTKPLQLTRNSIIFVHSLGCDHDKTWIHDGTYWPKAILPLNLSHARIIAYHYQTNFAGFLQDNQTVLYDQTSQFLLSLIHIRANILSRQSVSIVT